ncbi:TSUP family transporter [Microbulbifer sp. GL-2]|uniref:TSUP family transporter n=1 Tax=Microbulbifer sp. GL-2 TaxID=2591606 RepID=UPI00117F02FB|nr:TSUP family transporter [Microbulbifer sp. GL-2]
MIEFSSDITSTTLLILTAVAFAAGFINAISGGGGLITLPALLWAGLPPLDALGTNKFQAVFGTLSSSLNYFHKGHLQLQPLWTGLIAALAGSAVGTWTITKLGAESLETLLPILIITIALYFAFSPRISDIDSEPRMRQGSFNLIVGSVVGFYGGFFGPGIGSIFATAFTALLGYNMRKATASTKPLVLATNTISLVIFIASGHLALILGITMAIAQVIGARLGSNLVISHGAKLVKPVVIFATIAVAIKLLMEP